MESDSRQSSVRSSQRGKMSVRKMAATYGHRFARRLFLTSFHGKEIESIIEVEESLVSDALLKLSQEVREEDRKRITCMIRNHIFEKLRSMNLDTDQMETLSEIVVAKTDEEIFPTVN